MQSYYGRGQKKLIKFKLEDGKSDEVLIEITEQTSMKPSDAGMKGDIITAARTLGAAIGGARSLGSTILKAILPMDQPSLDEIAVEFGMTFNSEQSLVVSSVGSECNFKVTLTLRNMKGNNPAMNGQ